MDSKTLTAHRVVSDLVEICSKYQKVFIMFNSPEYQAMINVAKTYSKMTKQSQEEDATIETEESDSETSETGTTE